MSILNSARLPLRVGDRPLRLFPWQQAGSGGGDGDGDGGAFLWHAQLTPAAGGKTTEIDGMDLVVLRGELLARNEVYFDRMVLFGG